MREFLKQLDHLDLQAAILESEDPVAALGMWKHAVEMLAEHGESPDPELQYVRGYFGYMIWARTGNMHTEAENAFRACLSAVPNHLMARFYLGCLYFESGDVSRARVVFETLRSSAHRFVDLGQEWRYVKALEMLLAIACKDRSELDISRLLAEWATTFERLEEPYSITPLVIVGQLETMLQRHDSSEWMPVVCKQVADMVALSRSASVIRKHFPMYSSEWLNDSKHHS